ncbi:MAG: hypothetical protein ABIK28_11720, partial [Planctomycetota bacterium]
VLPDSAIHGGAGDTHCWVADPNSNNFRRIAVKKGPSFENETVVYGTLEEGQKVLLGTLKQP